jgi:hypothetical protein
MLKKHGQLYFSSLFFSDTLAIALAWFLAYTIRFCDSLSNRTATNFGGVFNLYKNI